MPFNPEQYRPLLSPETRFMCDVLSPGFDPLTLDVADKLRFINPDKLLGDLTVHRLYPHFYKIWSQVSQTPEMVGGTDYKSAPACGGLEPQWIDFNARLRQKVEHNRIQMLQKTATLVKIVREFEKEGIPVIALKGPALAQRLYNDVAMRFSWDTDVLIPPGYIDKAAGILLSLQYDCNLYDKRATQKQKEYTRKYLKHLSFVNPLINDCVEVHWELSQLKTLKSKELPDIWETMQETYIGNTRVHILHPSLELIYLMAHGADHSFYRLAWLLDIINIIQKHPEWASIDLDVDYRMVQLNKTTCTLGSIVFNFPKVMANDGNRAYLKHCFQTIQSIRGNATKPLIIREYWGKVLLTPSYILRPILFFPLLISPKDWKLIRLPDSLFFMYFLLRPFLYVYRLFFAPNKYLNS